MHVLRLIPIEEIMKARKWQEILIRDRNKELEERENLLAVCFPLGIIDDDDSQEAKERNQ